MNRELLKDELSQDEAVRLRLYKDSVGKWTIGRGHNIEDKGLSLVVVDMIYQEDVAEVEADLDRALPWWRNLSENRQRVLANMCFNMGLPVLLTFVNTLAAMERGDFLAAASGMRNSKWAGQVGARADRLAKRMEEG